MIYNPLSQLDRIEKSNILTNRVIVKALQSDRGDIIRVMNNVDLKMMVVSVFQAVHNILAEETRRAYDYACDKYVLERDGIASDQTAEFKPMSDVEIEDKVSAYFEIDGKLQYRGVKFESFIALPWIDESVECLTQQVKMGVRGMRYNPYSVADRLEKADILTNIEIMTRLQGEMGDFIRSMSYAEFKRWRKDIFSVYYHGLYTEAADNFDQACEEYVPERDGIENDPLKTFRPKNEFEIVKEIKAYFEEQDTLN